MTDIERNPPPLFDREKYRLQDPIEALEKFYNDELYYWFMERIQKIEEELLNLKSKKKAMGDLVDRINKFNASGELR